MVIDRERFLLLFGAFAACHEARETGTVTLSGIPEPPPPHAPTFCESLARKNEAVLANPVLSEENRKERKAQCGPDTDTSVLASLLNPRQRPAFMSYCHEGKGGTWAVVLVSASLDDPGGEGPPCGWAATYKLVHRDAMNRVATSTERQYLLWLNEHAEFKIDKLDDVDHDGQDEIFISETTWQNGDMRCNDPSRTDECSAVDEPTVEILTAKGDKVEPYAAGKR
jgi:hypothetical protein